MTAQDICTFPSSLEPFQAPGKFIPGMEGSACANSCMTWAPAMVRRKGTRSTFLSPAWVELFSQKGKKGVSFFSVPSLATWPVHILAKTSPLTPGKIISELEGLACMQRATWGRKGSGYLHITGLKGPACANIWNPWFLYVISLR